MRAESPLWFWLCDSLYHCLSLLVNCICKYFISLCYKVLENRNCVLFLCSCSKSSINKCLLLLWSWFVGKTPLPLQIMWFVLSPWQIKNSCRHISNPNKGLHKHFKILKYWNRWDHWIEINFNHYPPHF